MKSNRPDVSPVEIDPAVPDAALPDADWADTFELRTTCQFSDMRQLAHLTVGTLPKWVRALMRVRNVAVAPFGLKSDGKGDAPSGDLIGLFPIISETDNRIVLGMDDFHLDFRIVVTRERLESGDVVRLTTLVKRNNCLGHGYLAAIMPFHKLIVPRVMVQAV